MDCMKAKFPNNSQLFNDTNLNASDTFAVTGKTVIQKCTPEEFCLSQTPCSQEQFDSLDQDNKFEALQSIVNVSYSGYIIFEMG